MKSVTVITVNFKTPVLLRECVESFLAHYSGTPYILIDNGGCAKSRECVKALARKYSCIRPVFNAKNTGHGLALNQGIKMCRTDYIFTLDSDTKVTRGGFLELMLKRFAADPKLFATGWLRYVNDNGVPFPHQELKRGHPYVHPHAALMHRARHLTLCGFENSGAPSTKMMIAAIKKGYHLGSFPIADYVWHKVAGTRGMFRGQYRNIPTNRKPEAWRYHRI